MKKQRAIQPYFRVPGVDLETVHPDGSVSYERRYPCRNWHCRELSHRTPDCPDQREVGPYRQPPFPPEARVLAKIRRRQAHPYSADPVWRQRLRVILFVTAVIVLLALMLASN
ncbi:hypothetical protein ACGFQG_32330 [Nocardia fluminea]|uniref:hypothetical protein n=1 Tax=Nocardia fluminea TaxID=134984 RepID=UPI003721888D